MLHQFCIASLLRLSVANNQKHYLIPQIQYTTFNYSIVMFGESKSVIAIQHMFVSFIRVFLVIVISSPIVFRNRYLKIIN